MITGKGYEVLFDRKSDPQIDLQHGHVRAIGQKR